MTKRGKVLRDTSSGPGLIMLEGQQYRFSPGTVSKPGTPPKPGAVVDVTLDAQGQVEAVTLVPDYLLAQGEAELPVRSNPRSNPPAASIAGFTNLAAVGLLAAAWLMMTAISIQPTLSANLDFNFWQLLGFLRSGHVSSPLDVRNNPGLYGLLALAALAGPLLPRFWKDKRAHMAGLFPLAFMSVVAVAVRRAFLADLFLRNATLAPSPGEISIGGGTYASILLGLYFAIASVRTMVSDRAAHKHHMDPPQQKAA